MEFILEQNLLPVTQWLLVVWRLVVFVIEILFEYNWKILDRFIVTLVFNQGSRDMLKEVVDFCDFEAETLAMMKLVKVLKKEIMGMKIINLVGVFTGLPK